MADVVVETLPRRSASTSPSIAASPTSSTNQRRPIRLRQLPAPVPEHTMRETAAISGQVVDDIILWSLGRASRKAPNEYAETMRTVVGGMLDKHSSLFRGMMTRINSTASEDVASAVTAVADEEFGDGEANWGRITALCAFVARLARHFKENNANENNNNDDATTEAMKNALRGYFSERLDKWIAAEGGWDKFSCRFQTERSLEPVIFKGLLATGLILGLIAGAVALR